MECFAYAQAFGEECLSHLMMIDQRYAELYKWTQILESYELLGKKINKHIQHVENERNKF